MSTSSSNLEMNFGDGSRDISPAWKQELNERLAATRARRARRMEEHATLPTLGQYVTKAESRASRLAARVAERYANAPSYSEFLAAEARAAAEAADEAANAAVNAASQARAASEALLAGLEAQAENSPALVQHAPMQPALVQHEPLPRWLDQPPAVEAREILPVRALRNEADVVRSVADPIQSLAGTGRRSPGADRLSEPLLNVEDALEEAVVAPAQPLPVNLIEFPRELVAPRRARPRLAEGPLRETAEETAHDQAQLRIFEVAPESISKTVQVDQSAPEWSTIRLDAKPAGWSSEQENAANLELPFKTAPLEDRLMSGIVDLALVTVAFVLFILVFAACTTHPPTGKPAFFAAGLVLAGLFLLYQYLFFKFGEGTPGMRYAKIALCTFEEENPERAAMCRRILFLVLSAAPLGLGFIWAWFDGDRLGWHDRLTRMYQRSYRT